MTESDEYELRSLFVIFRETNVCTTEMSTLPMIFLQKDANTSFFFSRKISRSVMTRFRNHPEIADISRTQIIANEMKNI
jgi:hypothetical protein